MKYLEENYADVIYHKEIEIVEISWKSYTSDEVYKETLNTALNVIKENKIRLWLSDMTNAKVVSNAATEWAKNVFIPDALQAGVRKAAFVLSKDVFRRFYVDNIASTILGTGAELKYFDDRNNAISWLTMK